MAQPFSPWFNLPMPQGQGPLLAEADMPQAPQPTVEPPQPIKRQVAMAPPAPKPERFIGKTGNQTLFDTIQADLAAREAATGGLRDRIANMPGEDKSNWQNWNLKPLMTLADSWVGTNTAQGYTPPGADKTLKQKLEEQLQKEKQSISDDRLKLMDSLAKQNQFDESQAYKEAFLQAYRDKNEQLNERAKEKGSKEKTPSSTAFAAGGFARRLQQTGEILDSLASRGYYGPSRVDQLKDLGPNEVRDPNLQQYNQAVINFINATLRRESGAAISPSEFESARQQYLPQPGDSPAVLSQKAANRRQQFESFKAEGGHAFDQIPYISPTKSIQRKEGQAQMVRIQAPDGSIVNVPSGEADAALKAGGRRVE